MSRGSRTNRSNQNQNKFIRNPSLQPYMKAKGRDKTVSPKPVWCLNLPIKNLENTKNMAFAHLMKADLMSLGNSSEKNGYNESQFSKHYK